MKIEANPIFTTAIKFTAPGPGGRMETKRFDGTFKYLDKDAYEELMDAARAKGKAGGDGDQHIIDAVMTNWADVTDPSGNDIVFSKEALSSACKTFMSLRPAIVTGWVNAQLGVEQGN